MSNELTTPKQDIVTMELPFSDCKVLAEYLEELGYDIVTIHKNSKMLATLKITHREKKQLELEAINQHLQTLKNKNVMPFNTKDWGKIHSPY